MTTTTTTIAPGDVVRWTRAITLRVVEVRQLRSGGTIAIIEDGTTGRRSMFMPEQIADTEAAMPTTTIAPGDTIRWTRAITLRVVEVRQLRCGATIVITEDIDTGRRSVFTPEQIAGMERVS